MTGAPTPLGRFAPGIRAQALLLSVVPLTFLLLLCLIASMLQNETEQTAARSQLSTRALSESDAVQNAISDANRSVVEYTTRDPRPEALAPYRASVRDVPLHIAALKALARDNQALEVKAAQYGTLSADLMRILGEYLRLWRSGKKQAAKAFVASGYVRRTAFVWETANNDFDQSERELTLQRYDALHRTISLLDALLLLSSIAGILLTLGVTAWFGLRIARRLERLAENARALAEERPTRAMGGSDEIADLDRVYQEMSRRIHETVQLKDEALVAYEQAHHVASTLQHALLPQQLPRLADVTFDGFYQPAKAEAQLGGDWFDALKLADGRIVISIGDVAGSGLQAAVIMVGMREVIRGVAQVYPDPQAMIDAADRTLKSEHPESFVTAFVGVFDPVARTLAYVSAGHPAPLLRRSDGTVTELPSQGLPLGLRLREDVDARTTDIPDGATLVLYTDGLVESTQDVVEGERRLRDALADSEINARPDIARALRDRVLSHGARDDVAILAMRLVESGTEAEVQHEVPAPRRWLFATDDPETAQRARAAFAGLLRDAGVIDDEVFTAELIFGELLSNTVRYAPGPVEVVLDWSGASTAILHFLDRGPGFVLLPRLPSDLLSERGRGLFLVWSLSEDFNVTKRRDGGSHARVVLSPRRSRVSRPPTRTAETIVRVPS